MESVYKLLVILKILNVLSKLKSSVVQKHEKELATLIEEMRKVRETDNENIRELQEEKEALAGAVKYSAKALEALNAEEVCVMDFLFALLPIIL